MATQNRTFSFLDVQASLNGPGGQFLLSEGGVANEGISITTNERVTTIYGADGEFMHSLHAAKGGKVTVRCLRTGKINSDLSRIYAYNSQSSSNTGHDIISIRDIARGDSWVCAGCAIVKIPDNSYSTEGSVVEWVFNAGTIVGVFGTGTPAAMLG